MKNIKVHAIVLALIIIAEMIGNVSFKIGVGTIVLLPMLYALIMGIFMAPKFLKVVNQKDMLDASSLIGITLMLLMARYGTLVGPTLPKILAASPALILQEFGNLGTVFIGVPVAIYLGLKRETIGAAHSIAREPNVALIGERYGLDSAEGRGVMGVYIAGTVFGTIFFGVMASFAAAYLPFHPYALAMAAGVGLCQYDDCCRRLFKRYVSADGGSDRRLWRSQQYALRSGRPVYVHLDGFAADRVAV